MNKNYENNQCDENGETDQSDDKYKNLEKVYPGRCRNVHMYICTVLCTKSVIAIDEIMRMVRKLG